MSAILYVGIKRNFKAERASIIDHPLHLEASGVLKFAANLHGQADGDGHGGPGGDGQGLNVGLYLGQVVVKGSELYHIAVCVCVDPANDIWQLQIHQLSKAKQK